MSYVVLCSITVSYFLVPRYKGGPALPRKMISVGAEQKQFIVEVFPLSLRLIDSRDQSEVPIRLSKKVLFPKYLMISS